MSLTLVTPIPASSTTYPSDISSNFQLIQDAFNAMEAAVSAIAGPTSGLQADIFDRYGLVGDHSYNLDLDAYAGGALLTIGRRPAPVSPETNVSAAYGIFGGSPERVFISGDTVLNAAGIVGGLPKTIYIGISANGVPQLFEDTLTPNILYAWSMTWDGVNLSSFRRIAPILPAYTLLQQVAGQVQSFDVQDDVTDFAAGDTDSLTAVLLPGDEDANGIDVRGSFELIGFFASVPAETENGYTSPVPAALPADAQVELDVYDGATKLNLAPLVIDTDAFPAKAFAAVDPAIGDAKYCFTAKTLRLKLNTLGANVSSASGIRWGAFVRPIHGRTRAAKDFSTSLI